MGIINKVTPIQSGKVYGTLNQPEVFVEYTGVDTDTAKTEVNNTTKQISVTATTYVVEVSALQGEISAEDFSRLAQSTSTKIAIKGLIEGKEINVLCSAAEARADSDTFYKYYGPEDASGYGYVITVTKTPTPGATTYHYVAEQQLIALMKEDFVTTVTVGGVAAGTQINKGDSVATLLQAILQGAQPTEDWTFKLFEASVPQIKITDSWKSEDLPRTVKSTGHIFYEYTTSVFNKGYLCFAFNKEIGLPKHLYMNGLPFDVLDSFNFSETVYNDITYYMYVAKDKTMFNNNNYYSISWADQEEK